MYVCKRQSTDWCMCVRDRVGRGEVAVELDKKERGGSRYMYNDRVERGKFAWLGHVEKFVFPSSLSKASPP